MHSKPIKIYKTRWHLIATLAVLVTPFLFLLLFSQLAQIGSKVLFQDLFDSFWRLVVAYVISAILGWICAVSFYKGKRAVIALPLFDVLQSFPTFAALPLAVYLWGASNFTVIVFMVMTVVWPIFFSTLSSLKLLKRDWEEAVENSRIRGMDYVRRYLWPASIPGLITGSVVGLGEGWEAIVATEIVVHIKPGLGSFFQSFSTNPSITAFGILGLLLFIFCINKLLWLPLLDWSHRLMEE